MSEPARPAVVHAGQVSLRFRPCTPDDVSVAVPLIFSSGPAAFRYVFSQRDADQAIEFLRVAFVQGEGEFGHRNHVVALLQEQVVAVGALWGRDAIAAFTRTALGQIVGFYGPWRGAAVVWRGLRIERVLRPPPADAGYIAHIGVAEALQGRGIGLAVMRFMLDQARLRGWRRVVLDVAAHNTRARDLYQGLGFALVRRTSVRLVSRFGRVGDHDCMQRVLETD